MKEKIKNNKGITLIALVVTIVIILILAGISMSTILGNNGLINKAHEAKKKHEQAASEEKLNLKLAEGSIDAILENFENSTALNEIISKIVGVEKIVYDYSTNIDTMHLIIKEDGKLYRVLYSDNGNFEYKEQVDNVDKNSIIAKKFLIDGDDNIKFLQSEIFENIQYESEIYTIVYFYDQNNDNIETIQLIKVEGIASVEKDITYNEFKKSEIIVNEDGKLVKKTLEMDGRMGGLILNTENVASVEKNDVLLKKVLFNEIDPKNKLNSQIFNNFRYETEVYSILNLQNNENKNIETMKIAKIEGISEIERDYYSENILKSDIILKENGKLVKKTLEMSDKDSGKVIKTENIASLQKNDVLFKKVLFNEITSNTAPVYTIEGKTYLARNSRVDDIETITLVEHQPVKMKVNSGTDGLVILPITEASMVDWGDGTKGYAKQENNIKLASNEMVKLERRNTYGINHNYSLKDSQYVVTIYGNIDEISSWDSVTYDNKSYKDRIIEILDWGDSRYNRVTLEDCVNLTKIASPKCDNFINMTNLSSMFQNCTSLQNIPNDLFNNCTKVLDMGYCFNGCKSLKSIPVDIFKDCINANDFGYTFENCSGLESIPVDLFKNCNKVESFRECFYKCTSLKGDVPKLWEKKYDIGDKRIDGDGCFAKCININGYATSEIPNYWKELGPR